MNRTSEISNPENCAINSSMVKSRLGANSRLAARADLRMVEVGDYSSIGRDSKVLCASIGKFSSISWNVTINARNHEVDKISTHAFPYAARLGFVDSDDLKYEKVFIGNDVWIGAGAIILPGISIGDGAVVGAGSIVTKDIEPYSIVAGNPAKVLRKRFCKEDVDSLMGIKWWDFPYCKIKENIDIFRDSDVKKIIKLLDNKCIG